MIKNILQSSEEQRIEDLILKQYLAPNIIECIPFVMHELLRTFPEKIFIIKGVEVIAITDNDKELIHDACGKMHGLPMTSPSTRTEFTHLICIDRIKYIEGVKERLLKEEYSASSPFTIQNFALVKQVLLSLTLHKPFFFEIDAGISILLKQEGTDRSFSSNGYGVGWVFSMSRPGGSVPGLHSWNTEFDNGAISDYALQLDPYFRPGMWIQNRVAASVAYFFDALISQSKLQSYVSLFSSLESLVNTSPNNVTAQIINRVPVICREYAVKNKGLKEDLKELYNVRSFLAHGRASKLKGLLRVDTITLVSPKLPNVAATSHHKLFEIAQHTIKEVIKNVDLLECYGASRQEKKVNKKISLYFNNVIDSHKTRKEKRTAYLTNLYRACKLLWLAIQGQS